MKISFSGIKVLVIGDLMLDTFVYTKSDRQSPENKNIPVLRLESEKSVPGGAANVAANIKQLGASVDLIGIVGKDEEAIKLTKCLKKMNIDTDRIIFDENKPTIEKKRFYLNEKQIFRFDKEEFFDNQDVLKKLKNDKEYDVIILSDYNKGTISKHLISCVSNAFDCPIVADPKKKDFSFYRGVNIITPNFNEYFLATGQNSFLENSINSSCKRLIKQHNFDFIVLTKSEKGISLIGKDIDYHIDAIPVTEVDVTGAGDSVIATLALSYALTNDIYFSTKIGNIAGHIAVSKKEIVNFTINELIEKMQEVEL